ncbi:MAG: hypothetical protein QOD75_1804 [Blastocatellia bacterium]|jgi:SAM-dependent methyltransferase|nr:hypothetical protein [Blastocatellia bacterium]
MSPEFTAINKVLDHLNVSFKLSDHTDFNQQRYPWSAGMLNQPALYAARLWEYPYAILAAELEPGMKVADIGCGMTPFTVYLKDNAGCDVTGVDPDVFEAGIKYKGFGVSEEFVQRTGLRFLKGDMDAIPLETDSQDRVYSISVMEHVPPDVRRRGIQEIARVLKPGGRAIVTMDVNMCSDLNRPLELVWESGLVPVGEFDFRWPQRRFGIFCDAQQPADVIGITLTKNTDLIETEYRANEDRVASVPRHLVPTLMTYAEAGPGPTASSPLWRRIGGRVIRSTRGGG